MPSNRARQGLGWLLALAGACTVDPDAGLVGDEASARPAEVPSPTGSDPAAVAQPAAVADLPVEGEPAADPPSADPCAEAAARAGARVCVTHLDLPTWGTIHRGDGVHWSPYLVPARADARLPALVADGHAYELHQVVLARGFGALFPDLAAADAAGDGPARDAIYAQLALNPRAREFYAGNLLERAGAFAFTLEEVASGPVTAEDVARVRAALAGLLAMPFTFEPSVVQAARGLAAGGATRPAAAARYVAYSRGEAFGTVRLVRADHVPVDLSRQDVLLLDAAPPDLAAPVAAVVYRTPTAEFSHLNVRSAARGSPACFDPDAGERLGAWAGKTVRVACTDAGLSVRAASAGEAAAWLQRTRPPPVTLAPVDLSGRDIVPLVDVPTATAGERAAARARYGTKAANYAALMQRVPPEWTYTGLAVPIALGASWLAGASPELPGWFADPAFLGDVATRRARLTALRSSLAQAPVPRDVLDRVGHAIEVSFGATTMVRLRSSSNAEDDLRFPGAGLYDSTSACLADDQDADDVGPSRCDPETAPERGLARGLRRVWGSLYTDRAVEERLWYGVPSAPQADGRYASMGILVDPRARDERANFVAFTAPVDATGRATFSVEAQSGDGEVVSTDPGIWPERVRLTIQAGQVEAIGRLAASSTGRPVLTDAQLREVGARLARIVDVWPLDPPEPSGAAGLDTEWKVLADGRIVIKQVRPYRLPGAR